MVLGMILRLPAIILAIGILRRVTRHGERALPLSPTAGCLFLIAFGILAVLWFCMDLPEFPSEFVPTMWSDFEFWEICSRSREKYGLLDGGRACLPGYGALDLVIYGSAAFCGVPLPLRQPQQCWYPYALTKRMMFYCAAYALTLCLISFKIASAHNMTFCKAMYLLPCLWICVDFLFYCLKETLPPMSVKGGLWMKKKREYSVPIREQMVPWLFLLPSLLFVSIMVLIPMLDALRRSFFLAAGDRFVGFQNYLSVLRNHAFQLAAANTTRFILVCIPLLLLFPWLFP